MIQRIQSIYMLILLLVNISLAISTYSKSFILVSYLGNFSHYVYNFYFFEILSLLFLLNIFLFKYTKIQLNVLRFITLLLIFGIINLFYERSFTDSFKDLGLIYFITSFMLIFMALKSIKKDREILNSSNRLR
jgi:hypothetical protein